MADGLHEATLGIIARTPSVARSLLEDAPPATLAAPDEGGWSALTVVAHLVDRQPSQHQRIELMLSEDDPVILDEDEQAGLEASGLLDRPLGALLELLASRQATHVARYERLTASELARGGRHSVAGPITIADLLNHRAYHDLVHVQQIASLLAAGPDATRGAMGMFR
jgi:hypothetical protein